MASDIERAWVAGIIDADGCVTMQTKARGFRCPVLVVDSTDIEILTSLQDLYGGNLVLKKKSKLHHRQAWSWRCYGADNIRTVLNEVVPHMRCPSKVERARILIHEYPVVTKRNGRYTPEERAAKTEMEERFMDTGHGRGSSVRRPRPIRLLYSPPS